MVIRHNFPADYVVGRHIHPEAEEWVIFDKGKFNFFMEDEILEISDPKKTSVIYVPHGHAHGIVTLTNASYLVLRSGRDETIFIDEE